jgi:PIN domain nuclease of toxin-antitoxin system
MLTICDTHILIFWQDAPERLSINAAAAIEKGLKQKNLACSDISLWEIAMLSASGRIRNDIPIDGYLNDLITVLYLKVLPINPEIAAISQSELFPHKDPADRLIAATAIHHNAPLITADRKLQGFQQINTIW